MQALMIMSLLLTDANAASIPVGKSVVEARFGDVSLKLFTYKPKDYDDGPLIMVFHGVLRNADEYRDDSVEMGDRFRAPYCGTTFRLGRISQADVSVWRDCSKRQSGRSRGVDRPLRKSNRQRDSES